MSWEHSVQRVMSGRARGVGPALLRAALAAAEPAYRAAVGLRNGRFDRGRSAARRLPRPVVSVGNLSTGGTGKTPVVRWLAGELRRRGLRVAVLSRGYKASPGTLGDEQRMLLALLGDPGGGGEGGGERGDRGDGPPVLVEADPDRYAAGRRVLARQPGVDLFLLDDGFQHRRLYRDLDFVLLHAAEPFGYGHLLPRGLLREPIASLRRAAAVVLTNAVAATDAVAGTASVVGTAGGGGAVLPEAAPSGASQDQYAAVVAEVRRWNPHCPVVREWHAPAGFRSAGVPSHRPPDHPPQALATRRAFCFSGLGMPQGFEAQVRALAGAVVGQRRFPDHHDYSAEDLRAVRSAARAAGADVLVTTEKDWAKVGPIVGATLADGGAGAEAPDRGGHVDLPLWRLDVEARFPPGDGEALLELVARTVAGFDRGAADGGRDTSG